MGIGQSTAGAVAAVLITGAAAAGAPSASGRATGVLQVGITILSACTASNGGAEVSVDCWGAPYARSVGAAEPDPPAAAVQVKPGVAKPEQPPLPSLVTVTY